MNANRIDYVYKVFQSIYGVIDITAYISYASDNTDNKKIFIKKSPHVSGFFKPNTLIDHNNVAIATWKRGEIPFLFNSSDQSDLEIISETDGQVIINFDIIAASFYLLSGWQENNTEAKDKYGRFSYESSIQYKLDFARIPVVNYYFDILKTALEKQVGVKLPIISGKPQKPGCFLTHDIDIINTIWLEDIMLCIKTNRFFSIPGLMLSSLKNKYSRSLINEIIDIEIKRKVVSTWFFLGFKGKSKNIKCADYKISSKKVQKIISTVKDSGFEISIHGSPGSESDPDLLRREMSGTFPIATGNRFHFLLFDNALTTNVLQKSGIKYDTTLGFVESIGFRNSICHPFYLYDIINDKPTKVLEIPLNIMDTTLSRKEYPGNGSDRFEEITEVINEIEKFTGVITILWHNNYFSRFKHKGYKELYIRIIDYLKEKDTVFMTSSDIVRIYT